MKVCFELVNGVEIYNYIQVCLINCDYIVCVCIFLNVCIIFIFIVYLWIYLFDYVIFLINDELDIGFSF